MKKIIVFLMVFSVGFSFAQDKISPTIEKQGDLTLVTYFHDNGEVQQTGAFDNNGKLHGVWKSYDNDGKKLSIGTYENGRKVGKWLFWNGDSLKEVEFIDSKIMSVNKWNNKTKVAIRDK
ncbi:toxin-antitoxin system YwqK family antitoxin [Winogradskyella sp.]|uniref:toxin-antitoxin system YwqK family antitoxin n=1 Tax=Winogradskyella sp. TaxID=1883156 RepID=UPI003F695D6C